MKVQQFDPKDPLSKLILETDPNEDVAEIAVAIVAITDAAERLLSSNLTERAIKLLIRDLIPSTNRIGLSEIGAVLDALPRLREYLKP